MSVEIATVEYSFNDSKTRCKTGGYAREEVDPFPAYAHDKGLVEAEFNRIKGLFSLSYEVDVWILPLETIGRTNGWASPPNREWDSDRSEYSDQYGTGTIALVAKRIPPHPAMTRYLVAHEYGHHAEYQILIERGLETHDETLLEEYAELRKMKFPAYYGGGVWHQHPKEVFANDFRILICERETEYWPHEVPHPHLVTEVQEWWSKVKASREIP